MHRGLQAPQSRLVESHDHALLYAYRRDRVSAASLIIGFIPMNLMVGQRARVRYEMYTCMYRSWILTVCGRTMGPRIEDEP